MKIEKVIFTIDDNPHYKGFWKSISRHFKENMGIESKLFIISKDDMTETYSSEYGDVEHVDVLEGIPTIIQALIGKFYFTKTEPNTTWLIGDLDLYPLQKNHFTDSIKDISDDKYVHLHPYAYGEEWRDSYAGLAGFFHVAKGSVFERELNLNKTFREVCLEIYESNKYGIKFYHNRAAEVSKKASPDWGWFCSEEMYTGDLLKNSTSLVEVPPSDGYLRLDRGDMAKPDVIEQKLMGLNYEEEKLINNKYIDFHSPRPYEEYEDEIEKLILIPTDFNND